MTGSKIDKDKYKLPVVQKYVAEDIKKILIHLEEAGGFDDVVIATERRINVKINDVPVFITDRKISKEEVAEFLIALTKDKTADMGVSGGSELDDSLSIKVPGKRGEYYRYRLNASAFTIPYRNRGIAITLRSIKTDIPPLEKIGMSTDLADALMPRQGLVLVAGETGSGKSTSLASGLKYRVLRDPDEVGVWVLTYEAPIEYVHDYDCPNGSLIIQASVDERRGDTSTFYSGLRNALRRSPGIILIGEIRDFDTVDIAVHASSSGHLCLGTVHANTVAGVFGRLANYYPSQVQQAKLHQILDNSRAILVQYLAQKVGGGRLALREFLPLHSEVRNEISEKVSEQGLSHLVEIVNAAVDKYGFSMQSSAEKAFADGLISAIEKRKIISGI
ncbi:type IV pilus twitching motility protein PilT [Shewanella colwelliana]|uniref:type IV pilus twitching motility protein PilT n=1 Tax=Shewanella colwelliana TaxID=23 RepID=UPI0022AF29A0|nr:ATPase, T2SS/T4P/T4SS family [Shewanella colwelliana]MCZ4337766.1 ATPase, T2SS/T4P/T4SS family [Shewanella colwelliana]